MDLDFIIKDLEHTIEYFKEPKSATQIGRKYQAEKTLKQIKSLNIHTVMQQRELLITYEEYRHSDSYNLADGYEDVIKRFIAINCG